MMIKNIQFTNIKNDFQTKLRNAISDIQKSEKVLITADESRNIYQMETGDYKKLLHDNIRRTCQKSDERKINNINKDAKKIALVLDLEDRIEKMQGSESYNYHKRPERTLSSQNIMSSNKNIKVGHW